MSRIHPAENNNNSSRTSSSAGADHRDLAEARPSEFALRLTVWKRSSMSFQGTDGFTVFDGHGRLAFRVDNYTRMSSSRCVAGGGAGLVLMDGSGKALLTLIPQAFSMQHQWSGYRGGEDECCRVSKRSGIAASSKSSSHNITSSNKKRVFTMRRPSSLLMILPGSSGNTPCEAEVFVEKTPTPTRVSPPSSAGGGGGTTRSTVDNFRIEGSFRRRNCKIKDAGTGQVAAKIARKRAAAANISSTTTLLDFGDDVFNLVIQPGFDPDLMMAFVVILDRICGGAKPYTPVLCS
ncbi:hypothetical protein RJ640_023155 [Escallonia rubra]|uniref:Uncharacterized protein n=1 Tax=Escallonia rubra TaxID=112253 RepID=A0AA88RQE0_9ASTE|nr:hypothetical protein RJ640_023155 [Escallonia rubra]